MLNRRGRQTHRRTAVLRDVLESIAILLAGIWAVYVFAYEQRIKPAQAPPQIVITGVLNQEPARDGLIPFRFAITMKNTGTTPIYTIATAYTAIATRFKSGRIATDFVDGIPMRFEQDARPVLREPVYRMVNLGFRSGEGRQGGYTMEPGTEIPTSEVFFVRAGEFDEVALSTSLAFSKTQGIFPTRVSINDADDVIFQPVRESPDYGFYQVVIDRIIVKR